MQRTVIDVHNNEIVLVVFADQADVREGSEGNSHLHAHVSRRVRFEPTTLTGVARRDES